MSPNKYAATIFIKTTYKPGWRLRAKAITILYRMRIINQKELYKRFRALFVIEQTDQDGHFLRIL